MKRGALRASITDITRGGSPRANRLRSTAVRSMKSRMPGAWTTGGPATGSAGGAPTSRANDDAMSRNVWMPIGVSGSKTPCGTFAEASTRSSRSGSGRPDGSG